MKVIDKVFHLLLQAEFIFRCYDDEVLMNLKKTKKVLLDKAEQQTTAIQLEDCHGVKRALLTRYNINVRLHIFCKRVRLERTQEIEKSKTIKFNYLFIMPA